MRELVSVSVWFDERGIRAARGDTEDAGQRVVDAVGGIEARTNAVALAIAVHVFDVERLVAVPQVTGKRQACISLRHDVGGLVGGRLRLIDHLLGLCLRLLELLDLRRERGELRLECVDVGALRERRQRREAGPAHDGAGDGQGE